MGQHYVTRFYLKGFSSEDSNGKIHCYLKKKEKHFYASIAKVAQKKKLHPQNTEDYLTQEIEQPGNRVLKNLREGKFPDKIQKYEFCRYLGAQQKRVPHHKERMIEWGPHFRNRAIAYVYNKYKSIDPSFNKKINEILKKTSNEHFQDWTENIQKKKQNPKPDDSYITFVFNMNWYIFRNSTNVPLITNDDPVFFFESIGYGNKYSELSFPISSKLFLWASWIMDVDEGIYEASAELINEINHRTFNNASNQVFSQVDLKKLNVIKKDDKWKTNLISWDEKNKEFKLYEGIDKLQNIKYFDPIILKKILKIPF